MKTIQVDELDQKQAMVIAKLFSEARFDIKGEAIPVAANAAAWLNQLIDRIRNA